MSNIIISFIRTYVPVAVGAAVSWLLTLGFDVGAEAEVGLTVFLTGLAIAIYYALARALERWRPFFGILLGTQQQPVYQSVSTQAQLDKTA